MVKSSDEIRKWLHSDALRRAGADLTSLEFLVDSLFVIPNRLMPFNILVKILHSFYKSPFGVQPILLLFSMNSSVNKYSHLGALHFTASEVSADEITAPISPHRTSPPANSPPLHYTADKLHRLVNLRHDEFSAS